MTFKSLLVGYSKRPLRRQPEDATCCHTNRILLLVWSFVGPPVITMVAAFAVAHHLEGVWRAGRLGCAATGGQSG
jgi:hypothetical protein